MDEENHFIGFRLDGDWNCDLPLPFMDRGVVELGFCPRFVPFHEQGWQ